MIHGSQVTYRSHLAEHQAKASVRGQRDSGRGSWPADFQNRIAGRDKPVETGFVSAVVARGEEVVYRFELGMPCRLRFVHYRGKGIDV